MKRLGFVLTLFACLPVAAAGPPTVLRHSDPDRGYEWIAASRVLTLDGSLKKIQMPEMLRKELEWQLQNGGVADSALEDGAALTIGEAVSSGKGCAPKRSFGGLHIVTPRNDSWYIFSTALLLAEIAATATLGEAVHGFDHVSNPVALFELSDVTPLRNLSPAPAYALVPHHAMAVRGRTFCVTHGDAVSWSGGAPTTGDRVVLIGAWADDGILRTGASTGSMAVLRSDDRLEWQPGGIRRGDPGNLSDLHRQIDEAEAGGLFDLTLELTSQPYGTVGRLEFSAKQKRYYEAGCRVVEAGERPGAGVAPIRIVCQEATPPR